jgi:hypothetical protein
MPWNARCRASARVEVNRVSSAFAQQFASMRSEVTQKITSLHYERSDANRYGLSQSVTRSLPGSQFAIRFNNQGQRFLQVSAGLSQSALLRVNTGNLFNVGHVPAAPLFDYRGKLMLHNVDSSRISRFQTRLTAKRNRHLELRRPGNAARHDRQRAQPGNVQDDVDDFVDGDPSRKYLTVSALGIGYPCAAA